MKLPKTFVPEKNLEKNIKTLLNQKNHKPKLLNEGEPIWLKDICCKDEYGDIIEYYDKIFVKTSLATTNKKRASYFKLHGAVSFFERQKGDVFLPSAALTCNILAKLYELRHYEEMDNLLLQYLDYKANDGWHLQNTIIAWKAQRIIHYPGYSEVPKKIRKRDMNYNRDCKILGFALEHVEDTKLEFLLQEPSNLNFIKDLTGLEKPEILVEIGYYLRRPTRVWFPDDIERAKPSTVFVGCRNGYFDLYLGCGINYSGPARGVFTQDETA